MFDKPLGQVAYEGYGEATSWQTHDGRPMPRWEDLPERIRDAWQAAARAVGPRILGACPCVATACA